MDKIDLVEKKNGVKLIKATVEMAQNVFDRYTQHFAQMASEADDQKKPAAEKKVRKRDQIPEDWLKAK